MSYGGGPLTSESARFHSLSISSLAKPRYGKTPCYRPRQLYQELDGTALCRPKSFYKSFYRATLDRQNYYYVLISSKQKWLLFEVLDNVTEDDDLACLNSSFHSLIDEVGSERSSEG